MSFVQKWKRESKEYWNMSYAKKLKNLYKEKHKRDAIFQAFGLAQCHQLDWQINHVIEQIKKEGIKLINEVLSCR